MEKEPYVKAMDADLDAMQDAEELLEKGLLFEINRRVLHPFGLALAIETRAGRAIRISPRLVRTTDPEGMEFTQVDLVDGFRKYLAFMKDGGFVRLARRYEVLGFRSQVEPDVDPNADEVDWSPPAAELVLNARNVIHAARELGAAIRDLDFTEEAPGDLGDAIEPVMGLVRLVGELEVALAVLDGVEGQAEEPN